MKFPLQLLVPIRLRRPAPPARQPALPSEDVDLSGLDDPDRTAIVPLAEVERRRADQRRERIGWMRAWLGVRR